MKIIQNAEHYGVVRSKLINVLQRKAGLPGRVFDDRLGHFLFITFDDVFLKLFFEHVNSFLKEAGEPRWWMQTLDPDPTGYFATHYDFFGGVEFSNDDSSEEFVAAINFAPAGNSADAIIHNTNSIVALSDAVDWTVFAERESDIAVCAFASIEKMNMFRAFYGSDLLQSVGEAAEFAFSEDPEKKNEFLLNYS